MKVSKNRMQSYLDFELPTSDELIDRIGSQIGAVEDVQYTGSKYASAVIVIVVECAPLADSDHLNLCFVDDGGVTPNVVRREDGLVQVVCGAPNVGAGVRAVWLPPGATVPSTFDVQPFVLEARELRGSISNGMLASAKELAIGDSHEGLLLLNDDVNVGTTFTEAYGLNDVIIDIENKMFTHRPDCFGQLGVAREVAGILGHSFTSPTWYDELAVLPSGQGLALRVENEIPDLVPRFMALTLSNVTVAPSPVWLQTELSRVGLRPINNVVDVTNYMMMISGQPLHAYDYDRVAELSDGDGAHIVVRSVRDDEQLELLNGKTLKPRPGAMMISSDQASIGLGGVMGGANSETSATTTNIILEAASFDMYAVRRVSMANGLFTDAVTRFNKGQSPYQNRAVLAKAVQLLEELTGAVVAGEVIDINHAPPERPTVQISSSFVNTRLGLALSGEQITQILRNVEFSVTQDGDGITVKPPFWRTDIEIAEDIIEEVGRLHGFHNLPLVLPERSTARAQTNKLLQLKLRIRSSLARAGANELLTYSFVPATLLKKVLQEPNQAFKLSNALSPELQYYRFHALPSLLDKVHANIKAGFNSFALFEMSKGHTLSHVNDAEDGIPTEIEFLDLVFASKRTMAGAPFYQARSYLDALAADNGLKLSYSPINDDPEVQIAQPYDLKRSAHVNIVGSEITLGMVGEFKPSVLKQLKLPGYSAGFTVGLGEFLKATMATRSRYQPLSRYPAVEQDVCYRVPVGLAFSDLHGAIEGYLQSFKPPSSRVDTELLDIYQRDDADDKTKQVTFRIRLTHSEKTMTASEMSSLLSGLNDVVVNKYNAAVV